MSARLQTTIHVWYGGGTLADKIAKGSSWGAKDRACVQRDILMFVDGLRTYLKPGSRPGFPEDLRQYIVYHGDLKVWGRGLRVLQAFIVCLRFRFQTSAVERQFKLAIAAARFSFPPSPAALQHCLPGGQ